MIRKYAVRIFLLSLILVSPVARSASPGCAGALSAQDAAAVRATIEAYRTNWLRGDEKGVLATFSADATLLPPHAAKPIIGIAAITDYWWPVGAPATKLLQLDITVDGIGGDCQVAYAHGKDEVAWNTTENGVTKTEHHPGIYLNVLRKQPDGSWRIVYHMWDDPIQP